jgi:hypothetical protein
LADFPNLIRFDDAAFAVVIWSINQPGDFIQCWLLAIKTSNNKEPSSRGVKFIQILSFLYFLLQRILVAGCLQR